jgi:hypothetical protein
LKKQACINGRGKRWMHNSSYSMEAKIMLRYTILQPLMIVRVTLIREFFIEKVSSIIIPLS